MQALHSGSGWDRHRMYRRGPQNLGLLASGFSHSLGFLQRRGIDITNTRLGTPAQVDKWQVKKKNQHHTRSVDRIRSSRVETLELELERSDLTLNTEYDTTRPLSIDEQYRNDL
jgi:hypothetical protein